jgi:hypothetical protein
MVWDVIGNKTARYFLNLGNSLDKDAAKNKGVTRRVIVFDPFISSL